MERWRMNVQNIKVVNKLHYLWIFLDNTGCWSKQKPLGTEKGYHSLWAVGKCVWVMPNIKVWTLETIYEVACESEIRYGVEVLELNEAS